MIKKIIIRILLGLGIIMFCYTLSVNINYNKVIQIKEANINLHKLKGKS